jgi:hypothetical protein
MFDTFKHLSALLRDGVYTGIFFVKEKKKKIAFCYCNTGVSTG